MKTLKKLPALAKLLLGIWVLGVIIALAIVPRLATAAASSGPIGIDSIQQWFKAGFYVGSGVTANTTNKITGQWGGKYDFDFPACATSGLAGSATLCNQNSPGFTCGGAVGDDCRVNSDHSIADGGLDNGTWFDCSVVGTALCTVREHYAATDGGLYNVPDSGYVWHVTSYQ